MIVLDEELQGLGLEEAISSWYRGSVVLIKTLRPGTVIKDEAIPVVLRHVRQPTFITINHRDFWQHVVADKVFCVLCLKLTTDQVDEIPFWLRRVFELPEFKTKNARMGKVALVGSRSIQYYSDRSRLIHLRGWSASRRV
jgi:hypothetical protein